MRMSRCRRRSRTGPAERLVPRTAARLLLPLAVLALATAGPAMPATYARQATAGPGVAYSQIRTMSSDGALDLSSRRLHLGTVTAGQSTAGGLQVRNTSPRSLPLTVTVAGAPGFTVSISPGVIGPGQTAQIHVSGTPGHAGKVAGQVVVSAFANGFLSLSVPLTAEVKAPVAPAAPAVTNSKASAGKPAVPRSTPGAAKQPAPAGRKNG